MSCIAGACGRRALARMPALLRVLATAPVENRVSRLLTVAKTLVEHTGRDRKNSFEPFIYLTAEQPSPYDLVINTKVLGVDNAAALIAAAAE
jgi:cytidylate kinase